MKYAVLLLALMFAGVATPSMAQKAKPKTQAPQKLTFEFEGETIEVANKDFTNVMNWWDAIKACKKLGNGWRLPSIDELRVIYKQLHTEGMGDLSTHNTDWSSSTFSGIAKGAETYSAYDAWDFSFEDAKNDYPNYKENALHVRAVRTLPSLAQKVKPKPLSQAHKTANYGVECYAVTTREECEKCEAMGEYGEVSTPIITCSKCENV